jgi:hypothetical protein
VVVHRVVAAVELQMEEAEHSPGKRDGSEKPNMKPDVTSIRYETYVHPSYRTRHTAIGPGEVPSVADAATP